MFYFYFLFSINWCGWNHYKKYACGLNHYKKKEKEKEKEKKEKEKEKKYIKSKCHLIKGKVCNNQKLEWKKEVENNTNTVCFRKTKSWRKNDKNKT